MKKLSLLFTAVLAVVSVFAESTWVLDKSSGNANAYIISNDVWCFKFDYSRGNLGAYQSGSGVLDFAKAYADLLAADPKFKFVGMADNVINNKPGITKIIMPPTLLKLGWGSLGNNPDLEEIVFNDGFTSTGASSMSGNSALKYAVLPDSFTTAGADLFKNATALEYVVLSSNMTSCGNNPFAGCPALTNITYRGYAGPCDNAWLPNCDVPGSVAPSSALKGSIDLGGAKSIGGSAFSNCDGLTEVIATNVVSIGGDAFSGCDALTTFRSSDRLERILNQAFMNDYELASFSPMFPDTLTNFAGRCTFQNCKKLVGKVTIRNPDFAFTDNYAGINTFSGCIALQDADLSGVKKFVTGTFNGCTALTNVVLSTELEDVGGQTFKGCTALVNCSNTFPPTCTNIGGSAFQSCSALTNAIVISHESITTLPSYAFSGCSSLASVTFPPNAVTYQRQIIDLCRPNMDVYFLGKAPTGTDYHSLFPNDYNNPYVFHICPKMDPAGWEAVIKEPSANDLKRTLPEGKILGVETTLAGDNHCWLVKWHSPLLPYGLMLIVR